MRFKASEIEGNKMAPFGNSFSSLVDRCGLVSGGDMYPDRLCVVDTPAEYGGGGPEYVVVGLLIEPFVKTLMLGMAWRILSVESSRYFSKSKLVIGGSASLLVFVNDMIALYRAHLSSPLPSDGVERCHCRAPNQSGLLPVRRLRLTDKFQPCG